MALPKVGVQLALEGASGFFADLNKAQQGLGDLGKAAGDVGGAAKGIDAIGDAASRAGLKFDENSKRWRNALGHFASDAELAAAGIQKTGKSAGDAAAGIDKVGRSANDAGGGFSVLREVGIGALREVGAAAIDVSGQLAGMAAGFLADSVTAAGDFEASVNNLAAVSGTALAEAGFSFDDVSAKALQLGADTRFSASESIAAMTELVKGGVPVAAVMDEATQATLDLAAAAGVDLTNAAEIVAKQFGVWQSTGIGAGEISDLLTQAANASTVGVEDLALGLANVGGVAKVTGLDFGELTQTMALIAPGFSSAADAGTSLKTFLTSLNPATKPAREAMYDLGLYTEETGSAFFDASGNFVGMETAAQLLQASLKDLTAEQQQAALKAVFGQDAFRAAALIAEQGAEGFNNMGAAMAAAGTAAEVAAIQNQGWNFVLDQAKAGIETLQITIGTLLLPMLIPLAEAFGAITSQAVTFVNALTGNQEALTALSPTLQGVVATIQAVTGAFADAGPFSLEFAESLGLIHPALQPLMLGLMQVGNFIKSNFVPVFAAVAGGIAGSFIPGLLAASAAAGGMSGVFATVGAVVAGAGAAFLAVAAPIAIAAGLAAALATAWQNNLGGIRDATDQAMQAIGAAVQSGAAVVEAILSQLSAFWQANGTEIMAFAAQTWNQISTIIGGVVAIVMTIVGRLAADISTAFQAIAGFINAHGADIQAILTGAWQVIETMVGTTLANIQSVVNAVMALMQGDWQTAWEEIKAIVDRTITAAQSIIESVLGTIQTIWNNNQDAILAKAKEIWESVKAEIQGAIDSLPGMVQGAIDGALAIGSGIITGIIDGVSAGAGKLAAAVGQAAQDAFASAKAALGISSPSKVFADGVGQPISEGIALGIDQAAGTVTTALQTVGTEAVASGAAVGTAVTTAVAESVEAGGADLSAAFRQYFTAVVDDGDVLNDFLTHLPESARAATQQVGQALAAASAESTEAGAALAKTLSQYFDAVVEDGDTLNDFLADLPAGLRDAVQAIGSSLDTAAQDGAAATATLAKAVWTAQGGIATASDTIADKLGTLGESVASLLNEGMGTAILNAPGTGQELSGGIALGIERGKPAIEAALRTVSAAATKAGKAAFKISSPSQLFADEVGQPIIAGVAKGILDNVETLLDASAKMGAIVLSEAKAFAKTVQDALGPLLADAYKGAADYARSKAGALADLASLANVSMGSVDTSEYERLQKAVAEAGAEASRLFFGNDKDAAAGAKAIHMQLVEQRNVAKALIEQQRAAAKKTFDDQKAIAKESQQQIKAAQQAVMQIADPAERAAAFNSQKSAILETAKLRQQIASATTAEERANLEEQLAFTKEAQSAEFAIYATEAKARQAQRDQQLREAGEALKQLGNLVYYSQEDVFGKGEDLIKGLIKGAVSQTSALKDALGKMLADALAAMKKQMGIASPSKVFAVELGMPIGQGVVAGATRALGGLGAALTADLLGAAGVAAQTIRPALNGAQRAQGGSSSTTYAPQYNYSPTYQGAPRQPMQDFAIMKSLNGRG